MNRPLISLTIAFSLLLLGCGQKNITPKSLSITLYDKDTTTIKQYIQGKWKLQYYYIGFCGITNSCRVYVDSANYNYEFSNSQIKNTKKSKIIADTRYKFNLLKAYPTDYTHKILAFSQGQYEVVKIKNDTLVLALPFLYNPDYSEYLLTKIK